MSTTFSLAQVAEHSQKKDIYVAIHNKVYNVTSFIEEHPGGEEVLLDEAGKDATEAFEDIGHSDEAREILENYYVADLDEASKKDIKKTPIARAPAVTESSSTGSALRVVIPVLAVIGYLAYKYTGAQRA
ncbi:cytochrome b5-like heme/steroid binding domain-containing protein [Umbelopsis sp. AD052]|nr:cytochrome b5-like heme/steroid binding domain-containing protein [Umbelopsis sp. AD052]